MEAVETTTTVDLDTRVTTQPPPPPSSQAVSLQWLLDNVDNMIADLESCCCQDKVPPVNTSVSVVTPDTTEVINAEDKTGRVLLLVVSSSLYVSHMFVTRVLSRMVSRVTTGCTFTPCVGSFTSPGIDTS